MKKSSLISSIKLGRGSYIKVSNMPLYIAIHRYTKKPSTCSIGNLQMLQNLLKLGVAEQRIAKSPILHGLGLLHFILNVLIARACRLYE